jgi:hypothetical protein
MKLPTTGESMMAEALLDVLPSESRDFYLTLVLAPMGDRGYPGLVWGLSD